MLGAASSARKGSGGTASSGASTPGRSITLVARNWATMLGGTPVPTWPAPASHPGGGPPPRPGALRGGRGGLGAGRGGGRGDAVDQQLARDPPAARQLDRRGIGKT